ncbi:glycosyltransferase family 9 protein [Flavobacterium branchiophilum]|uniref:Probable heptosyltransferase involved in lipopolysaccharide core biosynthesis n=1 Tax=Flavobacterium branchiophilum (strain FL-15) TaxID=1034807 RepID=G2Z4H6_FLABF|nr:glycosyltransferase family 9 protein [Flavobacterium branchiophilum]CCB68451.1 Probable heptosyltransferase involved in lipopolysaccharide core biosynthesis [Flavobacterium branchiophilum FL-15]
MSKPIKHLMIFRLSAMGDVAMTVPNIRKLAHLYPNLKITMVSRPFFKPFFDDIPNLTFFAFDDKKRHKGFIGNLRLFIDLKKLKPDAFADWHNVLRSKIVSQLMAFSGIQTAQINKARKVKKALTRPKNKIFKPLTTVFDRQIEVLEQLGFQIKNASPIFPNFQPNKAIQNLIKPNKKHLGIAPFAQYQSKVYPFDLMQKLIQNLAQNPDYEVFLFGGGQKEKQLLTTLAATHPNVYNMAGCFDLATEMALISQLDLMLSMDSGNAHIAAMLGKKVLTLWGATHPYAGFLPFNQPIDYALVPNRNQYPLLPTSIYGNKKVAGYENVMQTIKVDEIINKIKQILQ